MDQSPNLSERILAVYYTADHYPNTRLAKTNEQTNMVFLKGNRHEQGFLIGRLFWEAGNKFSSL